MELMTISIDRPAPANAVRLEVLFQWCRTAIQKSPAMPGFRNSSPNYAVDGFVVTFPNPDSPPDIKASFFTNSNKERFNLAIAYEGERPRMAGYVWLTADDPKGINQDAELDHWLKARRRFAGDPAHAFFLELDEKTLVPFLRDRTNSGVKDLTSNALFRRLEARAKGARTIDLEEDIMPVCNEMSRVLTETIAKHFKGDLDKFGSALDRFAAGWLREYCDLLDKRIGGGGAMTIGCDADSANIFMFAEFAIAMHEKQKKADSLAWTAYFNHFIRMQTVYLARWGNNPPRGFDLYNFAAPILQGSIFDIQSKFKLIGDDETKLKQCMKESLRKVFGLDMS